MHCLQNPVRHQRQFLTNCRPSIGSSLLFVAIATFASCITPSAVSAHDTWVQSGSLLARPNDVVYVDLMLGNHGNDHRDFKLASKVTLDKCTLAVKLPDGASLDLKPSIVDFGSTPKEGYWSARFESKSSGLYEVVHTLDTLHGKFRAVKTAKTYLLISDSLSTINRSGFTSPTPINQNLEILLNTPVGQLSAKREIGCTILKHGKPQPGVRVSFIPRGTQLAEEMDPKFERLSNEKGFVAYTPDEGNLILIVAHNVAEDESGEGYEKTHYGATLVLPVPKRPLVD